MTRLPGAVLIPLGLILALGMGCATTRPISGPSGKPAYRSSRKVPDWVTRRPDIPGHFVTVGIATGSPSLEDGQRAAVAAAVSEIVTYLGIHAEILYTETRSDLEIQVTDQITARGAARVASGRTVEMYYEELRRAADGPDARAYDVYVLVAIPDSELEQERIRIQEELNTRRALAERLLQDGLEARMAGNFEGALTRWISLIEILQGDREARAMTREAEIEIARLVDDLEITAEVPETPTLTKVLLVSARLRLTEESLPLAGVPLRFFSSRQIGLANERVRTDDNGLASVEVESAAFQGGPMVLGAGVDVERLLRSEGFPEQFSAAALVSSLTRLRNKRAQVAVVGDGDPGMPDGASALLSDVFSGPGAFREDGLLFPSPPIPDRSFAGVDPVEITLLAGHDRIYAPGGRPEKCAAYLIDIEGPPAASPSRRPLNIALVLDRSGSMKDKSKLRYLKEAAKLLVSNLAPQDVFSLVTYAGEAELVRAAGTVSDPGLFHHAIDMIRASGSTNLSGGLISGIHQVEIYHSAEMLSRVILVSDGLANNGITDVSVLARHAARAAERGISVTTIGLGDDFDEDLLMALGNEGRGNYYYVSDPDGIPGILSEEMQGLSRVLAQNVTVELDLAPGVKFLNSLGIPYRQSGGKTIFQVGQISAGQRSRIALQIEAPPGQPGPIRFGTATVTYDGVANPGEKQQSVFPLGGIYTESLREADLSANEQVNRFVHILAVLDSMLIAKKSGSRRAIDEVLQYVAQETATLQSWLRQRDDQEMTDLLEMFKHCAMVLKEERENSIDRTSTHEQDLAKVISYKLYRLRHHPVWEAGRR